MNNRITLLNKCTLKYLNNSKIIIKNTNTNYLELYKYLNTRDFPYIPKIKKINDKQITFDYINEININDEEKSEKLIKIIALLHSKTIYFRQIKKDKYKELYTNIKQNIIYIKNYYNNLFDKYILEKYPKPSHYLLLKNYTLINNACNYVDIKLEEWFNEIKENTKQRICLIHNNISLDHFLINDEETLISWDNYTHETPIIDLYKFYKKEWNKINFKELLKIYQNTNELTKDELLLLYILISIPSIIEETNNELTNTRNYTKEINYLINTSKIID